MNSTPATGRAPIELAWRGYRASLLVVPPLFGLGAAQMCAQQYGYAWPYRPSEVAYMAVVAVPAAIGGAFWPVVLVLTGLGALGEHMQRMRGAGPARPFTHSRPGDTQLLRGDGARRREKPK